MNLVSQKLRSLIPKPVAIINAAGEFVLNKDIVIYTEEKFTEVANYLQKTLEEIIGWQIPIVTTERKKNQICLITNYDPHLPEEGYVINNVSSNIDISSYQPNGVFYAIQTLKQLFDKNSDGLYYIPRFIIRDFPRFQWRGFMLDEARHFMGKEVVKNVLDIMALHKLNKFHWHLVDDQGWRLEIKKYPKLIEIGSKRKLKAKRGEQPLDGEPESYGGYYTQEDIREIVTYASERFIEVIPEIELPGHCSAALAAYPELSCTGKSFEVPSRWGFFADTYCPGKKKVYTFLNNIFKEVLDLFPSEVIHIGGDEVIKKRWKKCPDCQELMQKEGMSNVSELHGYITNYYINFLKKKNRKLMGWSQVIHPKLKGDALCQLWFGKQDYAFKYINNGGKAVSSKMLHTYLDYPYFMISLRKAYNFDPIPEQVNGNSTENILGLEPPLWTERVVDEKRLYYQMLPRLTAYAETAWTPKPQKDFKNFMKRLVTFIPRLEKMGVYNALKHATYK